MGHWPQTCLTGPSIVRSMLSLLIPPEQPHNLLQTKCFYVSLSEQMDEGRIPSPDQIIASI